MKVSLIITTYNWPSALSLVLQSALNQSYDNYEIIIADDGSSSDTRSLVNSYSSNKKNIEIFHVWQEDCGFRPARVRNKAVLKSTGDYLIFVDGDCILPACFIKDHVYLSQTGFFVAGSRVKLQKNITHQLLLFNKVPCLSFIYFIKLWIKRDLKRIHPAVKLPIYSFRDKRKSRWQGAVTCNLSVWRKDFYDVNGFDNNYVGWGLEDSDLIVRLIRNSTYRKDGKFYSFILHLHHREKDKDTESPNSNLFADVLFSNLHKCDSGLREVVDD